MQEARLSQIAHHNGIDATQLVKNAALRLVDEDEQFHADIEEAIAVAVARGQQQAELPGRAWKARI